MTPSKPSQPAATRGVRVPAARSRAARAVGTLLKPGMRVVLTTHVNADGDGVGSAVALWHLLTARKVRPVIANPTPVPERFQFLFERIARADGTSDALRHLGRADAIVVLDIADLGRLGHLAGAVEGARVPVACIDHHVSNGSLPEGPRLVDAHAAATGELVYDLARTVRWAITPEAARGLYVAIMTDTGGFRYSNTTARTLQVAAHLLEHGVHPEDIYARLYANEPEGKLRLLAEVLETLVVEQDHGLAWLTVPPGALERHRVQADDLDGIVEFPRSVRGVRLAIMFRQLASGRIKVSFRSVGDVDAAALAERFGGGGHRKAAGASLAADLADAQATVLTVARDVLRNGGAG